MESQTIRARQAELDRWARSKGWDRGPFRTWTNGRYTVALSARGYPKRAFVISGGETRREVAELEDVERFLDAVRMFGTEPAVAEPGPKVSG